MKGEHFTRVGNPERGLRVSLRKVGFLNGHLSNLPVYRPSRSWSGDNRAISFFPKLLFEGYRVDNGIVKHGSNAIQQASVGKRDDADLYN